MSKQELWKRALQYYIMHGIVYRENIPDSVEKGTTYFAKAPDGVILQLGEVGDEVAIGSYLHNNGPMAW